MYDLPDGMVFWGKKKRLPPSISCYGKLPATGDFVRLNAAGAESTAFDQWLGASIHNARESLGEHFHSCYQPAMGLFIYRGPDQGDEEPDRGMVGVWGASGDSAGRVYPMIVSTTYDYEEMLAVGPALPIVAWPFLQAAYGLVREGRSLPVDQFLARVGQLQPVALDPPENTAAGYRHWLQGQSCQALWETCFGTAASRFSVVHGVEATIEIFRGQERPQTSLALRFPLGAADAYAVAVWMDLTLRLAGWQRTVLNAFWTPLHDLVLHVGPPQVMTFRELIVEGSDAEHVTDLLRPPTVDEGTARQELGSRSEAVADVNQSIASLLQRLG